MPEMAKYLQISFRDNSLSPIRLKKVFLDCKSSLQEHLINLNTYKSVMYFGTLLVSDCQRKMDLKFKNEGFHFFLWQY